MQKQVTSAGWLATQEKRLGHDTLLLGIADVDGMCRPSGLNLFVFAGRRHAGALSPGLMDSRIDGMAGFRDASTENGDLVLDFFY